MPGKVNPVIPEVVNQVAFNIIGNDVTITMAAELEKACRKAFGKAPLTTFNLGGVVSANTGPDTLALVYVGKTRD